MKNLALALICASFVVFVSGSFVFAYYFAFSPGPRESRDLLPSIGGFSLPAMIPLPGGGGDRTSPAANDPAARRINVLLLGIDQRDDEQGAPTRSDTMIVVSVDPVARTAAMVSFPRDMWVQIPGFTDNRINVANFLGDAYKKDTGGGPQLAEKTILQNFNLKTDYYARINFRGFEKIVDTLGGVTVNVDNAIRDDEYPTEDYETMSIYIPAGVQHMNGKVALQYARSRHSENDFGRMRRQQKLLLAIRDRSLQLDVIPRLPTLMNTYKGAVDTDIPPTEILRLAGMLKDVGSGNVSNLVLDDKLAPPFVGEGGADLLMPNRSAIRRAIALVLLDPAVRDETAKLEIINGTDKSGLASRVGDYLNERGFDVLKVSSAERTDVKTTQVVVTGNKNTTAAALLAALKLSPQAMNQRPTNSSASPTDSADIRIIIGRDLSVVQ